MGEQDTIPEQVKAAIAVSTPCDLYGSCKELHKIKNKLFHDRFLKELVERLKAKQKRFPNELSFEEVNSIKTLKDFDDVYTSKAHGFKDALDYYAQCSSLQFLPRIKIPTLIINARDDSFLGRDCYPIEEAKNNPLLFLDMPKHGGHVGFFGPRNISYSEKIGLKFINEFF